jgi:hypothetical protein
MQAGISLLEQYVTMMTETLGRLSLCEPSRSGDVKSFSIKFSHSIRDLSPSNESLLDRFAGSRLPRELAGLVEHLRFKRDTGPSAGASTGPPANGSVRRGAFATSIARLDNI